jgi:hypothetical protein
LYEVQHLVLALQQQVVKTQEDTRPFGERAPAPRHLRRACTLHRQFQIRHRPRRDGADGAARVRRSHRNCLVGPIGERDPGQQPLQHRRFRGIYSS